MRLGGALAAVLLVASGAIAAACGSPTEDAAAQTADIHPVDRRLVGEAAPYEADPRLRPRNAELASSMLGRRRAAWEIVQRVVGPVERPLPGAGGQTIRLPRFQTWYSARDFEALTARVVGRLPRAARENGEPIERATVDDAFAWITNEGAVSDPEWSDERFAARRAELLTPGGAASIASQPDTRTLLSPALTRHLLQSYSEATRCWNALPEGTVPRPGAHAPCVRGGAFPRNAAVVKTSWIDAQAPFRAYDTSADALAKTLDRGEWGDGSPLAPPDAEHVYTMHRLADPARPEGPSQTMRLTGLHIATKELDHWVWITLWWSPEPDTDFGADRPDAIKALGPWANYKMCVAVDHDEHDDDPGGAFAESAPSLAAALRATHAGTARSWCSNPYIEDGARNAPTNCIGCHQHGGLRRPGPATIRREEASFPDHTRRKIRSDFPFDYLWSASSTTELGRILSEATTAP